MNQALLYRRIIATGGIGSGLFFQLLGNDTLGREESRMAKLLPYKDYCKQHIILHYISTLLRDTGNFETIAIGKVGDDDTGRTLVQQMQEAGIDTAFVKITDGAATMFSVCYLYPDHAGGNITTAESASNAVTAADIDECFAEVTPGSDTVVLAAPEVPVTTRTRLLEQGKQHGCLTIASVTSSEIQEFTSHRGFELTDLLFINFDEALSVAGNINAASRETVLLAAIRSIITHNKDITVFVTCGAEGVYCYQNDHFEFFPATQVQVVSTAGAGDAFLAGTVAALTCGFPLFRFNDLNIVTAIDIGIALASASVTSPHTINPDIHSDFLKPFLHDAH